MKSLTLLAFGAIVVLGACTPSEITSRMQNRDALFPEFDNPDAYHSDTATSPDYGPEVIGARADNDFMRFSTMSMAQ